MTHKKIAHKFPKEQELPNWALRRPIKFAETPPIILHSPTRKNPFDFI